MTLLSRRVLTFAATLLLAFSFLGLSVAQDSKIEEEFGCRVLPIPQPVKVKGKVEVIEFFWYGCPHCYDFEPELTAWVKRQPKDVIFRRVPVAFRDYFMPHSQMFYALEAMGKGDALNEKVMYAMHKENKRLMTENEIADWVTVQGIDRDAFLVTYRSFAVVSKARAARQLADAYQIDGAPTIVMQGRYMTSPSIAGTKAKTILVMDYLDQKIRRDKYK